MGKLNDLLAHPDEIVPLYHMWRAAQQIKNLPKDEDLAFCYGMLNKVSRSFAMVIQQLPNPLRDAICIFYLVLRGLDTVEDDMAIPVDEKLPVLMSFHKEIYKQGFTMQCGTEHYKELMAKFDAVVRAFRSLDQSFQVVIADITARMGQGMADFIEKEVRSLADYNLYCHYVAGLVGIGLCQLFVSSGLEGDDLCGVDDLANEMGLFLQKTNIIRDYLEDILEEPAPRMFWPRAVWGAYAYALEDFKRKEQRPKAVLCLNHMISDALQHMPKCLEYMRRLKNPNVFRFCAIPQVMAAGTLSLCYNNGDVFEGVVKMRRGQTARIFGEVGDLGGLYSWFITFLKELQRKAEDEVAADDPTRAQVQALIKANLDACETSLAGWQKLHNARVADATWSYDYQLLIVAFAWCYFAWGLGSGQLPAVAQPAAAALQQWVPLQAQQAAGTLVLLLLLLRVFIFRRV